MHVEAILVIRGRRIAFPEVGEDFLDVGVLDQEGTAILQFRSGDSAGNQAAAEGQAADAGGITSLGGAVAESAVLQGELAADEPDQGSLAGVAPAGTAAAPGDQGVLEQGRSGGVVEEQFSPAVGVVRTRQGHGLGGGAFTEEAAIDDEIGSTTAAGRGIAIQQHHGSSSQPQGAIGRHGEVSGHLDETAPDGLSGGQGAGNGLGHGSSQTSQGSGNRASIHCGGKAEIPRIPDRRQRLQSAVKAEVDTGAGVLELDGQQIGTRLDEGGEGGNVENSDT